MRQEELLGNIESLIEIERPRDCLKSIGEDIRILMPESDRLTTGELYNRRKVQTCRYESEIASTYKSRSDICELSLWFFSKIMKQCLSDNQFEYCVSEVFETFIGFYISLCCFVEDTAVDTCEDVEIRIVRENLERGEESSHFRFKLHTIIAK